MRNHNNFINPLSTWPKFRLKYKSFRQTMHTAVARGRTNHLPIVNSTFNLKKPSIQKIGTINVLFITVINNFTLK